MIGFCGCYLLMEAGEGLHVGMLVFVGRQWINSEPKLSNS
jgi:hypothetical protein